MAVGVQGGHASNSRARRAGFATLPPHVAAMQQRCESSKQQCEKLLQSSHKQNQCFRERSRNVEVKGGQSMKEKSFGAYIATSAQ